MILILRFDNTPRISIKCLQLRIFCYRRSGKVCFEVKILSYNDVTCKDVDSHVARVGWSTDDATLQLGEDKNSFGFGGTGKKSVNRKFANYGRRFEKGFCGDFNKIFARVVNRKITFLTYWVL